MRHGFAILTMVLSMSSIAAPVPPQNLPEPQDLSVVYLLRDSGQLVDLERQIPAWNPQGVKALLVVPGERSPVRFRADEKLQFVVRVTEGYANAVKTLQFFRFNQENGARQLLVRRLNGMPSGGSLAVTTERYGISSFKFVPAAKLTPGEYCISRTTIRQGYCFGVDAGNP